MTRFGEEYFRILLGAVVFSTATLIASTLVLIDGSGTSAKNASG